MTWTLIGQSFRVLWLDKKLIVFPVLSGLAAAAIAAIYLFAALGASPTLQSGGWTYASMFLGYCAGSFAMIFFNCALAACVQVRFAGGEPSIAEGLRQAGSRTGAILLWALISSTVGLVLNLLRGRGGWVDKIVTSLAGLAWGMATYMIVPVLVIENAGVIESIRRSGALLRKNWGQQIAYGLTFGWLTLLFLIPLVVLGAIAMNYSLWMLPVAIAFGLFALAVMAALRGVFVVALYRYAASGEAPGGYSPDVLQRAFRPR